MVDKKFIWASLVVAFIGVGLTTTIYSSLSFWLCAPYFVLITLDLIQSFKPSSTPEEDEQISTPECEKMNEKLDEWNAIARFIEWLKENRMCVAVWRDPEAPYENLNTGETGTIKEMAPHVLEHPYPYGQMTDNLLYKYFGVDPAELERERRQILESQREAGF